MSIPLEEGFTVVTGPNGSGKSNILDGVLFCLGLASSRGMRADRLPDLVNSGLLREGKSAETSVSVRFDLTDWEPDPAEEGLEIPNEGPWIKNGQKEWVVTRRLRVMPGGSYSSSYSADGEACNLQQLQTQLRRLRIDPEGSNVVMQGDVTRIVSMSNKDRRGLIDELAGVALFDSRIEQTRSKLNDVYERQERCGIVQQELLASKQKLERDCAKARTYKQLKEEHLLGRKHEIVLTFSKMKADICILKEKSQKLVEAEKRDSESLRNSEKRLKESIEKLKGLQESVKELGEDQLLKVQAELAGIDTQQRELDRQSLQHKQEGELLQKNREDLFLQRQEIEQSNTHLDESPDQEQLDNAEKFCLEAESAVELSRRRIKEIAGQSGAWVDEQRQRSSHRQELQSQISFLQKEEQQLKERASKDLDRQKELEEEQNIDKAENKQMHAQLQKIEAEWHTLLERIDQKKKEIDESIESLSIQKRTRLRLEQEQKKLEKEIARIESRRETIFESRGTGALRLLLESGLEGIHGPVAQLGEVSEHYRLALEVAAGARMSQIVVDDDVIASKAINLLKLKKAGRLTFLPLNKLKSITNIALSKVERNAIEGCLGKALELITFEPIYRNVFSYVFGETLVYKDLTSARGKIGNCRAVTIDGELLERSGAITGGSFATRNHRLSFGNSNDKDDSAPLKERLLELGETLIRCSKEESTQSQILEKSRPLINELLQRKAGLEAEKEASNRSNNPLIKRSNERFEKLNLLKQNQEGYKVRLQNISKELAPILKEINDINKQEELYQAKGDSNTWKTLQADLEDSDKKLEDARRNRDNLLNLQRERKLTSQRIEDQQNALKIDETRLQNAVKKLSIAHDEWKKSQTQLHEKRNDLEVQKSNIENRFGEKRRARDAAELEVSNQRQMLQETQWKLERLKEDLVSLAEELRNRTIRLKELEHSLPDPLPEIPEDVQEGGLENLQNKLQQLQARMEALEPVNMLALDELKELESRLTDLGERLEVLDQERTELLLRIETVATLRQEAFMEAFNAVDEHFREIFASLSEGDGHLQLDNQENPLEGGLTLVAHPKGKAVRRLAAMSGGEKSLTALSFLFALQRFRPSPFYALDEVDSFLDGVNVERLSTLIARQAEQAQFLVVSHRRPMIAASSRTIGVTQARGSHTQVVGLPDAA